MADEPTRILVVDDSALYRETIRNVLREVSGISIVGVAKDGLEAIEQIQKLDPDLLTLDVQMPDMDGIGVLREINRRRLRPKAIMVSGLTSEGAQVTTDALLEGAFDLVLKPSGSDTAENRQRLRDALREKINAFRQAVENEEKQSRRRPRAARCVPADKVVEPSPAPSSSCRAVLIGTSTGGPAALRVVLPRLPVEVPVPILVVQHMPPQYTKSLAMRLDEMCPLEVLEAKDGDDVRPGRVLIAPGGRQMKLAVRNAGVVVRITDDAAEHGCRPAVDYLLRSAVEAFEGRVLSVIMTGMGRDGARGAAELKQAGGYVFAQHEDGCVVYGMPKAAIEQGAVDRVLPLGKIAPAIVRHVKRSRNA